MKVQQTIISATLVLVIAIITPASSPLEAEQRTRLLLLHSTAATSLHLTTLESAYLDAYEVLNADGRCRQFFHGDRSRLVLAEMVLKLRTRRFNDSRIGIRMFGSFTNLVEPQQGISYRLFEQAEINTNGAFYKAKVFPAEPFVPNVGTFKPNTRQARVLILLHELAHLIKGQDGAWLIPDDGGNPGLSRQNTATIESACGQQIRAL